MGHPTYSMVQCSVYAPPPPLSPSLYDTFMTSCFEPKIQNYIAVVFYYYRSLQWELTCAMFFVNEAVAVQYLEASVWKFCS